MAKDVLGWLIVGITLYAAVCLAWWLWRNEPDHEGLTPRKLIAVLAVTAGTALLVVLWWAGAFESPRERCARLASRAFPVVGANDASQEREWNRYFYRCLAKNRAEGIEVD